MPLTMVSCLLATSGITKLFTKREHLEEAGNLSPLTQYTLCKQGQGYYLGDMKDAD
jgi:hypothetical protein